MADGKRRQIDQQLGEIELGIDFMATAGAREAGQDGRRSSSARVANEERVLAIEHHALHFAFADVIVCALPRCILLPGVNPGRLTLAPVGNTQGGSGGNEWSEAL